MPDMTGNAATLRNGRYRFNAYASILPRSVVFAASVNGTPTFPATSIEVDNVTSGAIGNVIEGQTIEFFNGSGVSRGKLRVGTGGGSGTTLQIAEVSSGTVNIANNDTLVVTEEWLIWDRLVSATAALNKDSRTAYSDQGSNPPPVCNSGGLYAGFVDSAGNLDVPFVGADSYVIDPDSGGTITHLWDFDGGSGTTNIADPTATFTAGNYTVVHTATDAGNSKATTQYVPVFAHDTSTNPPKEILVRSMNYNPQTGWSCIFELPDGTDSSETSFPDGALIVIWEDEHHGDTNASYGSNASSRSHIKFVGFLDRTTISIDADDNTVEFTAISPLGVLAKTPALPQLTVNDATPAKWREIKSNSVYRTLWYLWYWHNTAFNLFDFRRPSGGDLAYKRLAAGVTSNMLEQYRDIASSLSLTVTADWLGRLLTDRNPQLEDTTDRSARTEAYDLTTADIVRIEWETTWHYPNKAVIGEGITDGTSGNKAVFSRAPGVAPSPRGMGTETLNKQIVDDQDDLNWRTGAYWSMTNSLYYGRKVPQGMRLSVPDGYHIFDPALQEFVTLTLPATTNKRGVAFTSADRWLVVGADIAYSENNTKDITYTLDHETWFDGDADALTEIRPTPSENGLPNWNLPDWEFGGWYLPPIEIGDSLVQGTQTLASVHSGGVAITTDFNTTEVAGGPTWTNYTSATLGVTGTITNAAVDPFSPLYLGTGTAVNAWLITQNQIGKLSDIFGSISYSVQHTFSPAMPVAFRCNIETTRGVQNLVAATMNYQSQAGHTGVWSIVSTDGGITWGSQVQVSSFYDSAGYRFQPGLQVGRAGVLYTTAPTSTTTTPPFTGRKSTNNGATWTTISGIAGYGMGGAVHIPWHDNASESIIYYGSFRASTGANKIYRNTADITPSFNGNDYGARHQRCIHTPDNNRQRVAVAGGTDANPGLADWTPKIFLSGDAGNNWTVTGDDFTGINKLHGIFVSEGGIVYTWGNDGTIRVGDWNTLVAGGLMDDRSGNHVTGVEIVAIIGG